MSGFRRLRTFFASGALFFGLGGGIAAAVCPEEQSVPVLPHDLELCRKLDPVVRDPSALPLREYELKLQEYFVNFCHRDKMSGWVRDKYVRDTGPETAHLTGGEWIGTYHGTHAPVVIWYSPEMFGWIKDNRTPADEDADTDKAPVPDGAIMVKEMYSSPASVCSAVEPEKLIPNIHGAAIMVRDSKKSHDGWFWGWFGWNGWAPDYPANQSSNLMVNMGFAQYCMNCHASARDNMTFSSQKNIEGEPGHPLVFLNQDEDPTPDTASNHPVVTLPTDQVRRLGQPLYAYNPAFTKAFQWNGPGAAPDYETVPKMPSETYDETFVAAGGPTIHDEYLTSSQCLGCHDAGSTGLQFDMTEPVSPDYGDGSDAAAGKMWNHSPYGSWRTSPMGLAGRDPIFFAQLASETQTFHKGKAKLVENTCLGCHGILGQRQYGIDVSTGKIEPIATMPKNEDPAGCGAFTREVVEATPWPSEKARNEHVEYADYGALARDGISCTSCHRMVLGENISNEVKERPENKCVVERQAFLNPDVSGFAKTFTGSFLVGGPETIFGPFEDPKTAPMLDSLGNKPAHNTTLAMSETCGTCHTVHLPVMHEGKTVGHVYEQLTYPEWAFSAYRTGTSPDGPLPEGAGSISKSCQDCHMPSKTADGEPVKSRIASIQEFSNFPQAEFNRGPDEIDLPVREGFAEHTLVGLNVFLTGMAQQFPDVLGIRTQDPMMGKKGMDPLIYTEQKMLDQAAKATADLAVTNVAVDPDTAVLKADVSITNHVGHKFPSGVGFRRAFVTFDVMDRLGNVIWSSGKTDGAGRILDPSGDPLPGEMWWEDDCSARIEPEKRLHQPHHQLITRQDQVQIYQELVSTPKPGSKNPQCGHDAKPEGQLTTSFLSICAEVKDNRLLPTGYLPLDQRKAIAAALGAGADMAEDAGSLGVGNDPDYKTGGGDKLTYAVPLADLAGAPVSVRARLSYQATPPFYLQDRFCTAKGKDRDRLYFLGGNLNLAGTQAEDWKFTIADTGSVTVPAGN